MFVIRHSSRGTRAHHVMDGRPFASLPAAATMAAMNVYTPLGAPPGSRVHIVTVMKRLDGLGNELRSDPRITQV
ncbi:hypothetical protein FCG67_10845 [Rhodococcus oryzae]|uniref:Uncharacterized protein n=1 Tax=Rhodococcus oryzae TaxID=2571143 RepID=A0ABY2RNV0_9NOCA|nr:hypothetical protein [Rhodococcus oryzae]TJZ78519.1 hypothetical protein FCG67_10845 [Rhodococcus oryzae]